MLGQDMNSMLIGETAWWIYVEGETLGLVSKDIRIILRARRRLIAKISLMFPGRFNHNSLIQE
jgi:hypothetical protein